MRMRLASRTLLALLLGALALAVSAPAQAQATGATDVDITIPDIVILHYFTDVDVTISQAQMGAFLTGGTGNDAVAEGVAAAAGFSSDLAMVPSALTGDPSAATLLLQNAWAVRAISLAGGTQTELAITITDAVLNHAGGATMDISGGSVILGATTGATIQFATPGLANPAIGNVELTLDMTNSTEAGDYLDGVFTLQATNI